MCIYIYVHACTLHTELLAKLESAEPTSDSKSTSEETGATRGGASETRTSTGSSGVGDSGESENSLTYTKEQVEEVQRSDLTKRTVHKREGVSERERERQRQIDRQTERE